MSRVVTSMKSEPDLFRVRGAFSAETYHEFHQVEFSLSNAPWVAISPG